jgi:hypothetical protein
MPTPCTYCQGFGYVQVYSTVVSRVYCDCDAGEKRLQIIRAALEDIGLNPDSVEYQWPRRSNPGLRSN